MSLRPVLSHPPHVHAGERVAVISPSWAGPGVYPHVQDLALRRLRDELGLEPVELPATRKPGASPRERARDIEAAFADPGIRAVMASIGGDDQIKVLRHLDPDVLRANPKPFFGYSDNTNLLIYLWNLGIVGYYGGSTMVHLGRPGRMHPFTLASLRQALFDHGLPVEVTPAPDFTDEHGDWAAQSDATPEPPMRPAAGWSWRGDARSVTGPSWGGCLEILDVHLRAGRYVLEPEAYAGCVLLLETSEEMPSAQYVERVLTGMGERGLLEQFGAVVVGAPKAWTAEQPRSLAEREAYTVAQSEAVAAVLDEYHPGIPTVFGVEFGHTDPQVVMPYGGAITVDAAERRLFVTY